MFALVMSVFDLDVNLVGSTSVGIKLLINKLCKYSDMPLLELWHYGTLLA